MMKIPSPTMKQSVGDRHMISPTRHKFRSARRRKSSGRWLSAWVNKEVEVEVEYEYDMPHHSSSNTTSPYYKGLTDQSLAISDDISSSCPPPPPRPPTATTLLLSSGHSPYYKGLTDYSLVIDSWTPPHPLHNHPSHTTNTSNSSSSPYYWGLIDYSLALALHPPPNSSSILSINTGQHLLAHKLTLPPPTEMVSAPHVGFLSQDLRETQSEATLEEIELMTQGVNDDDHDDVDVDVEWKPLRENESEAIQVGVVLEENAEKTILDDDHVDVGLVIQERKPLRERVSEVLEENAETTDLDLVIEEKPLGERVSVSQDENVLEENTDLEEQLKDYGLGVGGEKAVPVSELPCKHNTAEEGNLYDYLWATKYQPNTLADFVCNTDKALHLKALVKEGCGCNHFIFEGPPNAGKRSMIRAMFREVFGADRVQVTEEYKSFNLKGEMVDNLQLRLKKSLHHVEVNLSEAKGYEKHVIVDLFKETYGKIINNSLPCSPENCQAIVLYEAEKLSLESLLYIKWLLEKYKGCSKVFFCCSDESKLQPVKSLCTTVRLSSPSTEEIVKILEYIGKEEGIKLSHDSVNKIIMRSKNNLRQAIRSLEATCRNKDTLEDDELVLTGWEDDILNIAKNIIEEQSPRQLYVIRRKLQSLMIHDVPPDCIYKSLVAELTSLVDDSLRSGVAKLDKEYNKAYEIKFESVKQFGYALNKQGGFDEKSNEPTKKNAINYLKVEEFIAKFMSWYKNSSKNNNHVQLDAGT